ncbi:MAG: MarR family transcriptional regulator [Burkholderiaceae bacterium]
MLTPARRRARARTGDAHRDFLPYLLNRLVAQINAPMQQTLRLRGLTMTHWRVLGFLAERDGLIVSELADRTMTDQATLSRALMRLEARGLVERVAGADDSRMVEIHLLPPGRRVYDALCVSAREVEAWAFAELDPLERDRLRATLEALGESMASRAFRGGADRAPALALMRAGTDDA